MRQRKGVGGRPALPNPTRVLSYSREGPGPPQQHGVRGAFLSASQCQQDASGSSGYPCVKLLGKALGWELLGTLGARRVPGHLRCFSPGLVRAFISQPGGAASQPSSVAAIEGGARRRKGWPVPTQSCLRDPARWAS